MVRRPRFNPATLPAYGRLMAGARRLQPGDTVTLPGNKQAAVVDTCRDLVKVKTESGHTLTIHADLLNPPTNN